ncbi:MULTISPECIES: transglutaminase domain-containing protein [Myroides]|uniref:Transglutaminase n=1 Tax=Myroides albus TaxID=2562892 RepID=A0A6I3LGZ8_9FLAO|nr:MULTISPECIES: transglutaminase domain-containing protein [Myroides]MTG97768.1 transglutaminase [Myroides albus]MVX35548.1 transglutaminase [Myroides sp. LoEW2-1]UVD79709.1 transglutaminase-like domain-containing protein [Myroides albus]UVD79724.1 transglutaminase-like domain-containing protein [Myroides albus]
MNTDNRGKKKWYTYIRIPKPWDSIIILLLNILITVPIFIILHHNIVDPEWPFQLDRILLFILIVAILQFLLQKLKTLLLIILFCYLGILTWTTIKGGYGYYEVYEDYRAMVYNMSEAPAPQDIIISKLLPFPNKNKIIRAIEFDNPQVRNFALLATTKHFTRTKGYYESRQLIQSLAIFKEIRTRWNYVNDPKGREYIATASESLIHFSGDCDDYSVLMAACIRAIGGTPRLIHTKGHMYPEMLIHNKADLEQAIYLIKEVLFREETKGREIYYHIDERGQIWLNLDYTARYPGGPFMSEEILGQLTLN